MLGWQHTGQDGDLILVLMDGGIGVWKILLQSSERAKVLILVLMDGGIGVGQSRHNLFQPSLS